MKDSIQKKIEERLKEFRINYFSEYRWVRERYNKPSADDFLASALQDIYNQGREDERGDNRKDLTIKDQDKWYRAGWKDGEREIREKFIKEINELVEALIWCSGSGDFQLEGKARKGWEKICKPLIEKYKKVH